jgi:hypothetical protein
MAIKIGSTIVFNDSSQMSWNILNSKPDIISTLVKTKTGDGNNPSAAPAYNVNYSSANGRLEILYNTNCACVCDCVCSVGCFLGSEQVLMADKSWKRLDEIRAGEWVSCHFNVTAPVLGIRQAMVFGNKMYRLNNDVITSGEHGFWSEQHKMWLISDKTDDKRSESPWRIVSQGSTDSPAVWHHLGSTIQTRQMVVGDKVVVGHHEVEIKKIERWHLPFSTPIYTLITTSSMIIRGGWVVGGWAGKDFDKPIRGDIERRLKMLRGEISQWTPYSNEINVRRKPHVCIV